MKTRKSYTTLLFLLVAAPLAAAAPPDPLRAEFRAALERAERGGADGADSEALRGYVLYPYLDVARLRRALAERPDDALDARIAARIQSDPDIPAVRELRREWLLSLAGRNRWSEFLGHVEDADTDPALVCHRFQAWLQTGGRPNLAADVLEVWLTGVQLPGACVAPFEWLRSQKSLTPEAHEQRARLALAANNPDLAWWLLNAVPPPRAAPLRRWARLQQAPAKELPALLADPAAQVDADALLEVWVRYAKSHADAAAAQLPRLVAAQRLAPAQLDVARRAVALGHAWSREPEALALFRIIPEAALDDVAHEWRVRAALWAGDWETAAAFLHRMPPALAADPRWTYWRARSLEALGSRQSEGIYRTLAQANGYAGVLASWRLKQKVRPVSRPLADDPELRAAIGARAPIQRARELYLVERIDWAAQEWRAALREALTAERIQAARLAASWGWYAQAVPTLSGLQLADDLGMLYPDVHGDLLDAAARSSGVPADWLYAVMRQESLFLPRAVSSSQAYGLMQLLLPTARHVASREKWPAPTREDLMQPRLNIAYGATYLRDMLARFDGHPLPALAGYNAGPNAAARWIPARPLDADVWIENIPFNQTRGYVAKVLWHTIVRAWQRTGEAQDPAPLLRPVGREPAP